MPIILLVCVFAAVAAHAEKKIYKCANADGSASFSPYPCGSGAQEMNVPVTAAPSPLPPSGPPASGAPKTPPTQPAPPDAEDIKCRQDAERLKTYPSQANLDLLQQRETQLVRSYTAKESEAVKVQIGNLDAEIAAEQVRLDQGRQNADRAFANAMARCDALKVEREKRRSSP